MDKWPKEKHDSHANETCAIDVARTAWWCVCSRKCSTALDENVPPLERPCSVQSSISISARHCPARGEPSGRTGSHTHMAPTLKFWICLQGNLSAFRQKSHWKLKIVKYSRLERAFCTFRILNAVKQHCFKTFLHLVCKHFILQEQMDLSKPLFKRTVFVVQFAEPSRHEAIFWCLFPSASLAMDHSNETIHWEQWEKKTKSKLKALKTSASEIQLK